MGELDGLEYDTIDLVYDFAIENFFTESLRNSGIQVDNFKSDLSDICRYFCLIS